MIKMSVIIPTHNNCEYLRNTIISLQEQKFPKNDYEIIVVDNNSTDNTPGVVEECKRNGEKEIVYVKEQNIGLHYARHRGAKIAKGEILAYVDDDVICDSNWLSELIKPYDDPEVGVVGGKILPKYEVEPPEWIKYFSSAYLSLIDEEGEVKESLTIFGCNFSIRKSVLFEVGGFNPDAFGDEKLIWYRGDGESGLIRKVRDAHKKTIYTPFAVVWHVIPKSRLTLDFYKRRAFMEGISDSFTECRVKGCGRIKSIFQIFMFGSISIILKILAVMNKFLKRDKYYYKGEVFSSYYKSRFLYALRLIYEKKLREHVKKEHWI